jgi:hypothetical protein
MKFIPTTVRSTLSTHLPTVFKPLPAPAPFTVSEILADFQAKIKQLTDVNAARQQVLESNKKAIENLLTENQKHAAEAQRAEAVAKKLADLVA